MKINNINSFNPTFGYISTRTVDMIRRQTQHATDGTDKRHQGMNSQDLHRLYELTKRASVLEKSVIDTSGNNWEEKKIQQIAVRSHCYGGGDRANIALFTIPTVSMFDAPTNNTQEILDTLENAVEYAEDSESDSSSHDIFDEYGWHGGVKEDKASAIDHRGFMAKHKDDLLGAIYEYTTGLRSIK